MVQDHRGNQSSQFTDQLPTRHPEPEQAPEHHQPAEPRLRRSCQERSPGSHRNHWHHNRSERSKPEPQERSKPERQERSTTAGSSGSDVRNGEYGSNGYDCSSRGCYHSNRCCYRSTCFAEHSRLLLLEHSKPERPVRSRLEKPEHSRTELSHSTNCNHGGRTLRFRRRPWRATPHSTQRKFSCRIPRLGGTENHTGGEVNRRPPCLPGDACVAAFLLICSIRSSKLS